MRIFLVAFFSSTFEIWYSKFDIALGVEKSSFRFFIFQMKPK